MQLRLQRSQRMSQGIASQKAIFCLDVRAYLTPEETANVAKYGLSGITLYNSEAAQRQVDKGQAHIATGSITGGLKGIGTMLLATLHLRVTINSIVRGQHIECKTLDEMLGAEEAIVQACQNLKQYLTTALTFDGREVLFDFSGDGAEPQVVAPNNTILQIPAPVLETSPSAEHVAEATATEPETAETTTAGEPAAAQPASQPASMPRYQQDPPPNNEFVEKLKYWWIDLSTLQKVLVGAGVLIVLDVIARIL